MGATPSRVVLVLGGAAALAATLGVLPVPTWVVAILVCVGCIAAVCVGLRQHRPPVPAAWWCFVATSAFAALSVASRSAVDAGAEPDWVQLAARFTPLLLCASLVAALAVMTWKAAVVTDLAGTLDAGIVAFAMFSVTWMVELHELLRAGRLDGFELATSTARPVLDVVLIAAAVRLGVAIRLRNWSYAMVIAAAVGFAGLDAARLAGQIGERLPAELVWLLPPVLLAAAALHPDASRRPEPNPLPRGWLTHRRFTLIFVATVAVPLIDLLAGSGGDRLVVATSCAVLFILVMTRVFWLMTAVARSQERLQHFAFHDPLTGLANRSLFADRVRHALRQRDREHVTVLLLDLDEFKSVNDSLGHQAGDALLVTAANRMRDCTREGDTVARLGGDEFAILLENPMAPEDVVTLSKRLLAAMAEPARFGHHELSIGASIGVATASDSDDVDSLLRSADVAMYLAKSKGKGCFEFFEDSMYDDATERLALKASLHAALDDGQFELHYQPIVQLEDQQLVSVEALIRWRHPERGFVQPDRFIPLAEENGLIVPIGRWVFHTACAQARQWQLNYPEHAELGVSVNVSVRQMRDPDLVGDVAAALADSGLAAQHLTIEITESQLMEETGRSAELIAELKALGVRIAIDDFGTGYSSLSYLRSFPVDVLKIDRSFVNELSQPGMSEALVRSVVYLADALGSKVTAEGIEGFDQAEVLARLGCHFGQGFLISKPLPIEELAWLLAMPLSRSLFAISTLRTPTGPSRLPPGLPGAPSMPRPSAALRLPVASAAGTS